MMPSPPPQESVCGHQYGPQLQCPSLAHYLYLGVFIEPPKCIMRGSLFERSVWLTGVYPEERPTIGTGVQDKSRGYFQPLVAFQNVEPFSKELRP